ncbi:MAG: putative Zn-dependent protease [Rhodospirillaceae bacterium]|nr:MAG: putative Zn-dependent protease [Rhodospirillaceae bacterium]
MSRRWGGNWRRIPKSPHCPNVFTVVNAAEYNAFATSGGFIYIMRGMLPFFNNEAEFAATLGHEMGHITARHVAKDTVFFRELNISWCEVKEVIALARQGGGAEDHPKYQEAVTYLRYSREAEHEADARGLRYMTAAGYDPAAMVEFEQNSIAHSALINRMAGLPEGEENVFHITLTHLRSLDRLRTIARASDETGNSKRRLGRERYLAALDGMVFGEAPEFGLVRGDQYLNPLLRFAMTVPRRWRHVFRRTPRFYARNDIFLEFGVLHGMVSSLKETIRNLAGSRSVEVSAIAPGGLEGAVAVTVVEAAVDQAMEVMRVAVRIAPEAVLILHMRCPVQFVSDYRRVFRDTAMSVRVLSETEVAALQPLRVRVVTVKPGESARRLAAMMPFGDFNGEMFAVLNGLPPGESLQTGAKVKVLAV